MGLRIASDHRMKHALNKLLACVLVFGAALGHASDVSRPEQDLTAIASLDLARYMGSWYEIAKFPNRFQQKCAADTRADYSLQPDGSVQVINRCRQANAEISEALGQARRVGDAGSARLQVRFAPAWLSFIPAVWGDYWVIDLDPGYQLVAVSEPKREYLWVLARTPRVDATAYDALLDRLAGKGFDLRRLEKTVHR